MNEKDYLPPICNVLQMEHMQCVCSSPDLAMFTLATADYESFEIDLVDF
jgi:hypothetical protein